MSNVDDLWEAMSKQGNVTPALLVASDASVVGQCYNPSEYTHLVQEIQKDADFLSALNDALDIDELQLPNIMEAYCEMMEVEEEFCRDDFENLINFCVGCGLHNYFNEKLDEVVKNKGISAITKDDCHIPVPKTIAEYAKDEYEPTIGYILGI